MFDIRQVKTNEEMEHIFNMTKESASVHLTSKQIRSDMEFDGYKYFIAYINEKPCGYYAICPQDFDMCIVIKKVYIKDEYLDKNIEEAFINYLSKKYKNGNYQTFILYAGISEKIDIRVYERLGFVCVNRLETDDCKLACKII